VSTFRVLKDEGGDDRGEDVPERPPGLHDADRLVAVLWRPGLAHEHGAGGPFAAHADPKKRAPEKQLEDAL
jgi:hypothetical protein